MLPLGRSQYPSAGFSSLLLPGVFRTWITRIRRKATLPSEEETGAITNTRGGAGPATRPTIMQSAHLRHHNRQDRAQSLKPGTSSGIIPISWRAAFASLTRARPAWRSPSSATIHPSSARI